MLPSSLLFLFACRLCWSSERKLRVLLFSSEELSLELAIVLCLFVCLFVWKLVNTSSIHLNVSSDVSLALYSFFSRRMCRQRK